MENAKHKVQNKSYSETIEGMIDAGTETFNKAQQEVSQYSEELVHAIKKHPLKAVLIAGGIGMVLSALLRK